MKNPIQPIQLNEFDRPRFKQNAIVRYLLDSGMFSMNDIADLDVSNEDREQFAQLIGYTLDGFAELSYASDDTYLAALKMSEGGDEKDARIAVLEETLAQARVNARALATGLFRVHPDDLKD